MSKRARSPAPAKKGAAKTPRSGGAGKRSGKASAASSDTVVVLEPPFTKIVEGLKGAEGPVFASDGTFYMVAPEVEKRGKAAGEVWRVGVDEAGKCKGKAPKTKVAAPVCPTSGDGGIPAGCQADLEGGIWIADMRLGLIAMGPDGTVTQVVREYTDARGPAGKGKGKGKGKKGKGTTAMQGCNDCAFDSRGNLFVTAPAGEIAPAPYARSWNEDEAFGTVYCFEGMGARTAAGMASSAPVEPRVVDSGFRFCNGLAVTRDDSTLIVAETPTKKLWAYDLHYDGEGDDARVTWDNKRVWADVPGDHLGGADGMDFDAGGNLLVANWGSGFIEVYRPAADNSTGKLWRRVKLPFDNVSNVHFKPNSTTVYVTEHSHHGLWSFEWLLPGQPQFCDLRTGTGGAAKAGGKGKPAAKAKAKASAKASAKGEAKATGAARPAGGAGRGGARSKSPGPKSKGKSKGKA